MSETKKTCPLAVAKAIARMKEQHPITDWKAAHTSVMIRYMAEDSLAEAIAAVAKDPAKKVQEEFRARFKAALSTDAWIVESSNCGKQLIALGEIEKTETAYE